MTRAARTPGRAVARRERTPPWNIDRSGAPASRCRRSDSAAGRSAAATARSTSPSSPAPWAARSTSASTASTPPRATALRSRRSGGTGPPPGGGDRRHQVRLRLPRQAGNCATASRDRVMASIDKSLKQLGTDWVDVFLVHWPDRETPFEETMDALDEVVARGQGALRRRLELQQGGDRGVHGPPPDRRRPVRLAHVRPPDEPGRLPVLPGRGHRGHGLRVAGVRAADRHLHRGHGLRHAGLASPEGQDGLDQALRHPLRRRTRSRATSARSRSSSASRRSTTRACPSSRCAGPCRIPRSAPRSSAAERSPRSRTTPARSAGRSTDSDLTEIDAIFERHEVETVPGLLDRG